MDNKTPIQEAIEKVNNIMFMKGGYNVQKEVIDILESLLSKEKEFVGEVFEAGERNARTESGVYYAAPNKEQFIYQLYPEK